MPAEPNQNPAGTMGLDDVYYTLFRHKWKILGCSLAGVAAAVYFFLTTPPLYESQAKLFVRYVVENGSLDTSSDPQKRSDSQVRPTDPRGENIINSEIEILGSTDLTMLVVDGVGPQKILAQAGGGNDRYRAAEAVRKNLLLEAPRRSSVILLAFRHPDPELVQAVLRQLIDAYIKKHSAVHRAEGLFDDFLTKETDRLRSQLATTEADLQRLKTNAGVLSIEEARRAYVTETSQIRQELVNAEAELALRRSSIQQLDQGAAATSGSTNHPLAIPPDKLTDHRNLTARLELLRNRRNELLLQFTAEHAMVKVIEQLLTETDRQRSDLVKQYPALAATVTSADRPVAPAVNPADELGQISALQAKIAVLSNHLETLRIEAGTMEEAQGRIAQLQRQKELEEANYRYYSAKLEQARMDETLGTGKLANISEVQAPSAPRRDRSNLKKPLAMCLFGGLGLGLALAFLLEMFLDPTVRRPSELVGKLHLPLLLSIPTIQRNGDARPSEGPRVPATEQSLVSAILADTPGKRTPTEIAAWDTGHHLFPYHQALRDRLMTYFEVNNLTHKPKLVAVTGCSAGSGVTTLAAGLAATLSETGDGKVLLVDMNQEMGAAHPFFKGRPACNLTDSLEREKREGAMIQDRLYMAAENPRDRLPNVLPNRFSSLVPRLKASDYDYIIFDMPSVNATSVTPRLARFMDLVLLVVESEKTNRHQLKQAGALLAESKANVHAVLNKRRAYVPRWLQSDL
jgi:uncharacterized protein involved in exopolysaccharide biosynthesis/Mrp family chromosome partitioning ATPase